MDHNLDLAFSEKLLSKFRSNVHGTMTVFVDMTEDDGYRCSMLGQPEIMFFQQLQRHVEDCRGRCVIAGSFPAAIVREMLRNGPVFRANDVDFWVSEVCEADVMNFLVNLRVKCSSLWNIVSLNKFRPGDNTIEGEDDDYFTKDNLLLIVNVSLRHVPEGKLFKVQIILWAGKFLTSAGLFDSVTSEFDINVVQCGLLDPTRPWRVWFFNKRGLLYHCNKTFAVKLTPYTTPLGTGYTHHFPCRLSSSSGR